MLLTNTTNSVGAPDSGEAQEGTRANACPRVWVLLGKGTGGNAQMLELATALGWPYEAKQLHYNRFNRCPNLLLGASRLSLDSERSDPLSPPWPDLVIAASRRSAPVARWIKRESGGRTRLVHLLHTQAPLSHFDLVITMPQFRLPQRANVLCLTGALNRASSVVSAAAAAEWGTHFKELPRPWVALIAGGDSSSYDFDPAIAAELGKVASVSVRAEGGSLLVSTTPRTSAEAADALFAAVDAPAHCYRWRPNDDNNPYAGYLALADRFIVTVDSASLAMEACTTGKPVEVFEWKRRQRLLGSLPSVLDRWTAGGFYDAIVDLGLVKPARDFEAYHRTLREHGLTSRMGEWSTSTPAAPLTDLESAISRIRALLPGNRI